MSRARIEIKLGTENRLLKFNLAALKRYDESKGEDGASMNLLTVSPLTAILELTTSALSFPGNNNNLPNKEADELQEVVADWIDDLSAPQLKKLIDTMMEGLKKYGAALGDLEES